MSILETVLEQVRRKIVPSNLERRKMASVGDRLKQNVERTLSVSENRGRVSLQGSYARDTWLRNETDLDIFVQFPPSMDRNEWVETVLPSLRKDLGKYKPIERYAEHPFLEFYDEGIRVNIVPCYDVSKGDWKSATDRTPYHTEFMRDHLTDALRLQARFLKKFAKGINVYGAEIKTGGFSGMLVDTLALNYGRFLEVLQQASLWEPGTRLEIGQPPRAIDSKQRERGVDLVVIDPVDPHRNLASAVRQDKLWTFVAAARQFLSNPSPKFFFPSKLTKKTRSQFSKRIRQNQREIIAVTFAHPIMVADVLWGQLMKLEKNLVETLEREEFSVSRSTIWSDENKQSAILLDTTTFSLSTSRVHRGPPVSKSEDSGSFLRRHIGARDTVRGPWVENDRWYVEKKRRVSTVSDLVSKSLEDSSFGLSVPGEIGGLFRRSVRVRHGQEILKILGQPGFDQTLWQFMEAKPEWLRITRQ